jgi:hypothetical protein
MPHPRIRRAAGRLCRVRTIDDPGASPGLRARRDGKRLGRPPLNPKTPERIQEALRVPGRPGMRKIAAQFGVNASTVQQIASSMQAA